MKIKNIKKQLSNESKYFIPNVRDDVYSSVGFYPKDKRAIAHVNIGLKPVLAFAVLLIVMFSFILKPSSISNSFVIIEINPAIEIELDDNSYVVNVKSLNEDGYFFLEDLDIQGVSINNALIKIVDEATLRGFLQTNDSKISVNAVNQNLKKEQIINKLARNIIETYKPGIISNNDSLKVEAKEYNVSVGRMLLIKRALEADKSLEMEVALKKEVKELITIINKNADQKVERFEKEYKENLRNFDQKYDENLQEINRMKKELKDHMKELAKEIDRGIKVTEYISFVNTYFPEYKFDPINVKDLNTSLKEIEKYYDEYFDFIEEMVKDKYKALKDAYRNKVNENLKNNEFNFNFEIEEGFWFNNLENSYTNDEKEIVKIVNQLNALIKNRYSGANKRIEKLHDDYMKLLVKASEEFLNSNFIQNFEKEYEKYLEEVKEGPKHGPKEKN